MLDSVDAPRIAPATDSPARIGDRRTLWTALALGLLGVAVSAAGSWIPSFWGDEAASLMSAQRPLGSLFRMLGNVDAVHGTYYLFLHFWIDAFGNSPFSVRFPSAIAVGFAVVGTVLLAKKLSSYRVAVLAGVVCVFLPRMTAMGDEARSYAISAACAVWLTVFLVGLLERREARILRWAAYIALLAAAAYVFLFTLLLVAAHAVIVLAALRPWGAGASLRERAAAVWRDGCVRAWLLSVAAALVLASPIIYWAIREKNQIAYLSERDATAPEQLFIEQWFGNPVLAVLGWAAVVALGIAAVVVARRRRLGAAAVASAPHDVFAARTPALPSLFVVAASWAFIPMVLLLIANEISAMYTVRYFTFAAPAVAMLIALALAWPTKRWMTVAGLVAVLAAAIPTTFAQRTEFAKNESDWTQIAQVMSANAKAGDTVVFDESTMPSRRPRLAMHTYPAAFAGLNDVMLATPFTRSTWWWDRVHALPTVLDRFEGVHTVWLVEYAIAGKPDSYGMSDLKALGFTESRSFADHRSVVYELTR